MSDCQTHEENLSAWLDRELDSGAAAAALEHALGCESCRAFYLAARRLTTPAASADSAPEAPEALWGRIRERAGFEREPRANPSRVVWLARAAVVVLALAVGFALARGGVGTPRQEAAAQAGMDQGRFVQLTRELLASDPFYQRTMYQVLREAPAVTSSAVAEDVAEVRWVDPAPRTDGAAEAPRRPRL